MPTEVGILANGKESREESSKGGSSTLGDPGDLFMGSVMSLLFS